MSSSYHRHSGMFNGEFHCFNCKKLLLIEITGLYEIRLMCPRCKTKIFVSTLEPIPIATKNKEKANAPIIEKENGFAEAKAY